MHKKKARILWLIFVCAISLLTGCQQLEGLMGTAGKEETESAAGSSWELETLVIFPEYATKQSQPDEAPAQKPHPALSALLERGFTGEAAEDVEMDGSLSSYWEKLSPGEILLSEWDHLGRCGAAIMRAGKDYLPEGERGATGQARPSGWSQNKYPGLVDSEPPYLYNRAHLLAWSISGLTDNVKNLITGTRYFNTRGMLPTEIEVVRHVQYKNGDVLYRVTPIFVGDELLARGVLMEAESKDGALRFARFAWNVQPGVHIDYASGKNHAEGESQSTEEHGETTYVVNTNTRKFHKPSCESATEMKPQNRKEVSSTRDELLKQGYEPCGRCSP